MNNREIHYRYAISYLLMAIILLIALAYFDVEDLVDKLSFALTLSSLLLAVLAIFYTIVSSQKQEKNLDAIVAANSKLETFTRDLGSAVTKITLISNEIPSHLSAIGSKLDEMSIKYSGITDTEKQNATLKIDNLPEKDPVADFREKIMELKYSSMTVLYLFMRFYLSGTPITDKEWQELIAVERSYAVGMLDGFSATNLIGFKLIQGVVIPIRCEKVIIENLNTILDAILNVIREDSAVYISTCIRIVDEHFEK